MGRCDCGLGIQQLLSEERRLRVAMELDLGTASEALRVARMRLEESTLREQGTRLDNDRLRSAHRSLVDRAQKSAAFMSEAQHQRARAAYASEELALALRHAKEIRAEADGLRAQRKASGGDWRSPGTWTTMRLTKA